MKSPNISAAIRIYYEKNLQEHLENRKERLSMEIKINGTPKEIADLVVALQGQHIHNVVSFPINEVAEKLTHLQEKALRKAY